MKMIVREGRQEDAAAVVDVLCRSICELCHADHNDDPKEIADWTASKTPEAWIAWLDRGDATVLVAQKGQDIVGVGMVDQSGKILLNYVSPDARFLGVSRAIVTALERIAAEGGAQSCVLESTKTALRFYQSCGYSIEDNVSLRMRKTLISN